MEKGKGEKKLPRVNMRVLVFCALGLIFGIFVCFRVRFGGLRPSDFCFLLVFLAAAVFPITKKRVLCLLLCTAVFFGAGYLGAHLCTQSYLRGEESGRYTVSGTVASFTVERGYTSVILGDVSFGGKPVRGNMRVNLNSEDVRAGDVVRFTANVTKYGLPMSEEGGSEYEFYRDIRYRAGSVDFEKTGVSKNPFLRLQAKLYDVLSAHMDSPQSDIAFALLTGNSGGIDEGLGEEVRRGGVAHIFAISGLHIGILFSAVLLLAKPLGRKAYFPAAAAALLYTVFCAFTVSSVRALIMCLVLGAYRMRGRKYDFLQSIALAAAAVLLIRPSDFLSAGFRLSFGACMGLALFSGTFSRLLQKIPHFPRALAGYLSANVSVQLFTFPILLEAFGYFSVWGSLLNLVFIPALPLIFLTTLIFSVLSLIIPPAAGVFLLAPKGLLSLFTWAFSLGDFSFVLTGFSLGMGGVIYLIAMFLLSERFRMGKWTRAAALVVLAAFFTFAVVYENVVFTGGRVYVYAEDEGVAALIKTKRSNVLVMDGDMRARDCEELLSHRFAGTLDAVFVISENEQDGLNHAMFLDAACVYLKDEIPTGLQKTEVRFGDTAQIGGLRYTFLSRDVLTVTGEGVAIAFSFEKTRPAGADFFVDSSCGGLNFSFGHGIIKEL